MVEWWERRKRAIERGWGRGRGADEGGGCSEREGKGSVCRAGRVVVGEARWRTRRSCRGAEEVMTREEKAMPNRFDALETSTRTTQRVRLLCFPSSSRSTTTASRRGERTESPARAPEKEKMRVMLHGTESFQRRESVQYDLEGIEPFRRLLLPAGERREGSQQGGNDEKTGREKRTSSPSLPSTPSLSREGGRERASRHAQPPPTS